MIIVYVTFSIGIQLLPNLQNRYASFCLVGDRELCLECASAAGSGRPAAPGEEGMPGVHSTGAHWYCLTC